MKVLFIRPPRYMWPFNSESSSFWQPLGFASMAAVLRDNNYDVEIIDCLPLKIGWKSLAKLIQRKKPIIVGIGEETSSSNEGLRLIKLVKEIHTDCKVVCGGYHFPFMVEETFKNYPIDFIVKGEGEITFLELIKELEKPRRKQNFKKVLGIVFKDKNGKIIETGFRPLIKDIDTLPIPAYDLLPMSEYGKYGRNHPKLGAIEHGRGCPGNCTFCSINAHWNKNNVSYRTKSVKRTMEEIDILVNKYKRKTLGWVDGTWNSNPNWNKGWSQAMIEAGYDVWSTVWARADFVVRDHKLGILNKQIEAGVVQYVIGIERVDDVELKNLRKNETYGIVMKAFNILKEYPSVYSIGSFIYGLPNDTKKKLNKLFQLYKIKGSIVSGLFPLPFTPYPASVDWIKFKGKFRNEDFRKFNLHKAIMPTGYLSTKELNHFFNKFILYEAFHPKVLWNELRIRDKRKLRVEMKMKLNVLRAIYYFIQSKFNGEKYSFDYGKKPDWYEQ